VSDSIPRAARDVLERGALVYLAVPTSSGPHLTPVVYVLDGGRLWVTTSRGSVKARAWRREGTVAGLVRAGDACVTLRGRVRIHDALDPLSWPASVAAGPRLVRAATRFGLKNARFFAGYAVDAGRVPLAWMPPSRILAAIELAAGWVLDARGGEIEDGWGEWPGGARYRRSFAGLVKGRGIDLRVPQDIRRAVGASGAGAVAVDGRTGLTVMPAAWRRVSGEGSYDALVRTPLLDLAAAGPEARAALTVDRVSTWRASAMAGMMLQGTGQLFSMAHTDRGRRSLMTRMEALSDEGETNGRALIRLRPDRVVWWRGWTAGSASRRRSGGPP
jgi:hypothetical protein